MAMQRYGRHAPERAAARGARTVRGQRPAVPAVARATAHAALLAGLAACTGVPEGPTLVQGSAARPEAMTNALPAAATGAEVDPTGAAGDGTGGAARAEVAAAADGARPPILPVALDEDAYEGPVNDRLELRPDLFAGRGPVVWIGDETLPGIWIAHPAATTYARVRLFAPATGRAADGALVPAAAAEPSLSAEAAAALGLRLGRSEIVVVAVAWPGERAAITVRDVPVDPTLGPRVGAEPVAVASLLAAEETAAATPPADRAESVAPAREDDTAERAAGRLARRDDAAAVPDAAVEAAPEAAGPVFARAEAGRLDATATGTPAEAADREAPETGAPAPAPASESVADTGSRRASATPPAAAPAAPAPAPAAPATGAQDEAAQIALGDPATAASPDAAPRRVATFGPPLSALRRSEAGTTAGDAVADGDASAPSGGAEDAPLPTTATAPVASGDGAAGTAAAAPQEAATDTDPGAATETPSTPPAARFLQAGIFEEERYADRLVAGVEAAGLAAAALDFTFNGRPAKRVRIGPLASAAELDFAREVLAGYGIRDAVPVAR